MLSIDEELKKVIALREEIRGEFVISQKYKDQREWWVLGHFVNLLKESNSVYPIYAIKTKPNDPDFITYDINKNEFKPIEILEVLTPNRERGKEYKDSEKIVEPFVEAIQKVEKPWTSFIQNLNDKFLRIYQKNCWLLVYHNMDYGEISYNGFWHNTILANVELWKHSNLVNFSKCPYEKIFVIGNIKEALVSIYPEMKVLVPEILDGRYTISLY